MRRARAVCRLLAAIAIASTGGCSVVTSFDGFAPPCGDIVSSSANCGACGHDCLGGACIAGACQPVVLADQVPAPDLIAVDATDVYWVSYGQTAAEILRVPKGGGAVGSLGNITIDVYDMTLDASNLFVSTLDLNANEGFGSTAILRIAKDTGVPTMIAETNGATVGMTSDDNNIYWAEDTDGEEGDVIAAAKDGSGTRVIANVTGDEPSFGTAVDPSFVYWVDEASIVKAPIGGGDVIPLVGIGDYVDGLVLAGGLIVYTDPQSGLVNAEPAAGGNLMTLATSPAPTSIATDGVSIYWCDQASGAIYGAALGGPAKQLATGQADPYTIAVDDVAIYWTNLGVTATASGSIMRLAK